MAKKILVIDDDSIVSRTLKMLLRNAGYDVEIADSGLKALHIIKEDKFDLIVSDIRMPGMSGIETIKKLRENEKEEDKITPAVIITGYAGEGQYFPDEALGVTDYLYKPFENQEFLKMVKNALGTVSKPVKEEVYPRLKINFPIKIPPSFLTQGNDIGRFDLEAVLAKPRLLSKANVEIEVSAKTNIERIFKVIWTDKLLERKKFKYSGAFIRFKEKELDLLMDVLLKSSAEAITRDIKDEVLKKKISEFWQVDVKKFLNELNIFKNDVKDSENISEDRILHIEQFGNKLVKKGDNLTKQINDKKVIRKIKETFRHLGGDWFYQSEIMRKGFKKIRGYPGDFEMMNFVYNNCAVTNTTIGMCFDRFLLSNPYAAAVRGRKNKMVEILERKFQALKSSQGNFKLLNLACGPSREIQELFAKKIKVNVKTEYVCLDLDKEALDFSRQALANVPENVKMKFLQENILELLKKPKDYQDKLGERDIVYSIGLADYLPDKIMRKMINSCFTFLKPQGELILAFKITEKDPFAPVPPDWFCDWKFVPRSENDVEELFAASNIKNYSIKKEQEETGIIQYFSIKKRNI